MSDQNISCVVPGFSLANELSCQVAARKECYIPFPKCIAVRHPLLQIALNALMPHFFVFAKSFQLLQKLCRMLKF